MTGRNVRNVWGKIINAVWKLFYEQGYEDTTVREIIELSQTSEGSFYHCFGGKNILLSTLNLFFDEKHEELMDTFTPKIPAMGKLLSLNGGPFGMIEGSISLDLLARLPSTQLITTGEKHLLDHNHTYYKLLRRIIVQGQKSGELNAETSVNEMVKLYALSERALLYDQCLCADECPLRRYNASVMPASLSHFLSGQG